LIDEIEVSNLALIESAVIEPCAGLTALTGETGAGKTALLESCKLICGGRADKQQVREGTDGASVAVRLYVEGQELVVERRVAADGRSRARINGHMASVSSLQEQVAGAIDLCSQHDSQQLLQPGAHLALLDAFGAQEIDGAREAYAGAYDAWRCAQRELDAVQQAQNASAADLERARFVLEQIDALDPTPGEYEQLALDLKRAENAEALAEAQAGASEALNCDGGALDNVNAALYELEVAEKLDARLANVAQAVRDACFILEDASREISSMCDSFDFNAAELNAMQERFAHYQRLIRAYGVCAQDVIDARESAAKRVYASENSDAALAAAQAAERKAKARVEAAAATLTAARQAAAGRFGKQINAVLENLMMGTAQVQVALTPAGSFLATGADTVELTFKPSSAMSARPLVRIASGGELSRVMLAIHVALGARANSPTIIFDEIDAGVGGATALALADVLERLAKTHQVIVVTHLAQVAARAQKHYKVEKHEAAGVAKTTIAALDAPAREQEIARMLSGKITDVSVAHAQELLK
jgi:DNA repair protein RecN (Recombination protein N)